MLDCHEWRSCRRFLPPDFILSSPQSGFDLIIGLCSFLVVVGFIGLYWELLSVHRHVVPTASVRDKFFFFKFPYRFPRHVMLTRGQLVLALSQYARRQAPLVGQLLGCLFNSSLTWDSGSNRRCSSCHAALWVEPWPLGQPGGPNTLTYKYTV